MSDEEVDFTALDGSDFVSPDFQAGEEIGYATGLYDAYRQAQAAYDAAEIHLWLEYHKPKSMSDWIEWRSKYGPDEEFEKRWVPREDV